MHDVMPTFAFISRGMQQLSLPHVSPTN